MKLLKDKRAEIIRQVLQDQPATAELSPFEKARRALEKLGKGDERVVEVDPSQVVTTHCVSPQERREASAAVVLQLIQNRGPIQIGPLREDFVKRTKGQFRLGIGLSLSDFLLMELEAERVSLSETDFSITERGAGTIQQDLIQLVFPVGDCHDTDT